MTVVETADLTKEYGSTTAVDGIDLVVESGEVFGLLGPNGAGKSTLIDMLVGFQFPTSGDLSVLDVDPRTRAPEIRRLTGIVPDAYDVYDDRTGRVHVEYLATANGVPDPDVGRILERVGLADAIETPAGEYSKGMKRRLVVAMALVGDPALLTVLVPTSAYSFLSAVGSGNEPAVALPTLAALVALLLWTTVPVALAIARFRRADI